LIEPSTNSGPRLCRWRRLASAVAVAAVAVAAASCSASREQPVAKSLPKSVSTWADVVGASSDLGPAGPAQTLHVDLSLRTPRTGEAAAATAAMYDPSSPSFGQYITPAQYDAHYGPRAADVQPLRDAMKTLGLDLAWQPGSSRVTLSGPAAVFQRVLRVRVDNYRYADGRPFFASAGPPSLPEPLRSSVSTDVRRVTDWLPPLKPRLSFPAAVPRDGMRPQDLLTAYGIKPMRDQGIDGTGQTVVVWSLGDGFNQQDFDTYNQQFGLPAAQPTIMGPPANSEGETIMDIEAIHAVAPGAKIVVYTTPYANSDSNIMAAQQQIISDNPGAVISQSWGGCELGWSSTQLTTWKSLTDKAAQTGETLLFASGDDGGYECIRRGATSPDDTSIGVSMPASLPGVTAVGGTVLSISQDGGWHGEAPWSWPTDTEGDGGGVSKQFPRPSWQRAYGVDNKFNPGKMRGVPDVSAIGDPQSGLAMFGGGHWYHGGGTSLSTPLWAGMVALMNQYLKQKNLKPVGFMNPALYSIYSTSNPPYPAFHDITKGGNLVYPATPGYDLATGLGTPEVWNLARDLEQYQRKGGSGR
jgi:subtilase family serine protease